MCYPAVFCVFVCVCVCVCVALISSPCLFFLLPLLLVVDTIPLPHSPVPPFFIPFCCCGFSLI
jgi:hypothetical protein